MSCNKKVCFGNVAGSGEERLVLASQSQDHLQAVELNALFCGRKFNNNKTRMLYISSACTYTPRSFIITSDGTKILSVDKVKILGFHFNGEPSVKENLRVLQRKFKLRSWCLRHLKQNGFKNNELVRVYTAMIRPVAMYSTSVLHPMITVADSLELERIQMQDGWQTSYSK